MGNRAVITTPERKLGLYLHWNGGRDTVEPLLRYCELKGYRDPAKDAYGLRRFDGISLEDYRKRPFFIIPCDANAIPP